MCEWRFRIDLTGDPPDIGVVATALEGYPARLLNLSMERGCQSATGEFVVDLPHGEGVGPILSALHEISPTVLIGRERSCVTGRQGTAVTSAASWLRQAGDGPASHRRRRISRSRRAVAVSTDEL